LYVRIKAFPTHFSCWNASENGGIKCCVTKAVLRVAGGEEGMTSMEVVRKGEDLKFPSVGMALTHIIL